MVDAMLNVHFSTNVTYNDLVSQQFLDDDCENQFFSIISKLKFLHVVKKQHCSLFSHMLCLEINLKVMLRFVKHGLQNPLLRIHTVFAFDNYDILAWKPCVHGQGCLARR
jgi:hypothetical protein